MQTSRRTNPYPWTWEIPLGATLAVLTLLVLAAHAARTLANGLAGAGWDLTPTDQLATALPGILTGHSRAGLPPGPAASSAALYAWLAALELLVLAVIGWAAVAAARRWGPGRVHGTASRAEAENLLGLQHLRRVAPVVRPDLYARPSGRGKQ